MDAITITYGMTTTVDLPFERAVALVPLAADVKARLRRVLDAVAAG